MRTKVGPKTIDQLFPVILRIIVNEKIVPSDLTTQSC